MNLMEHKGLEVEVFCNNSFRNSNCLGCNNLTDTGFSYICDLTGEKLEGFDSMKDKLNDNMESFLPKHMGIGVGFQCPLPRVVGKMTHIEELFEEHEMCMHNSEVECDECGECGKSIPGRCCMDNRKECDSCFCC